MQIGVRVSFIANWCSEVVCILGGSDLGVHVDGYVALVATTIVVGNVPGKAADAIMAAKTASDVNHNPEH